MGLDIGKVDVRALVQRGGEADQPTAAGGSDDGHVEQSVVGDGAGTDRHTAPVGRAVTDRHQRRIDVRRVSVELDRVPDGPKPAQFQQHCDVVLRRAGRPLHPVGAFGDQTVESARQDGREPSVAHPPEVERSASIVDDDVRRRHRVVQRDSDEASEVVARPGRGDSQRGRGRGDCLQSEVDQSVAPDGHETVGPGADRSFGLIECFARSSALDGDDVDASLA